MSSYTSPVKTVDDCLDAAMFARVRQVAHRGQFGDVENPVDGLTYPGICTDVPMWMQRLFVAQIAKAMDWETSEVHIQTVFFRVTTTNTPVAPHQAHNDISHAEYSMFFYINNKPLDLEGIAGTSLLSHGVTGMNGWPRSVEEWECWNRDTNDYDAWHIDEMVFWESNRMAIYPAERMHRAEPVGGWGLDQTDGRLVLIIFFS